MVIFVCILKNGEHVQIHIFHKHVPTLSLDGVLNLFSLYRERTFVFFLCVYVFRKFSFSLRSFDMLKRQRVCWDMKNDILMYSLESQS